MNVLGIVRLSKPFDRQEVLERLNLQGTHETSYHDRTIRAIESKDALGLAICVINDRLLLFANSAKAMRRFLDLHDEALNGAGTSNPDDSGRPLLGALEEAAAAHQLVVAVAPAPLLSISELLKSPNEDPPDQGMRDVQELLKMDAALLTVNYSRHDRGESITEAVKAVLTLSFGDERRAETAAAACNRTLEKITAASQKSLTGSLPLEIAAKLLSPLRGAGFRADGGNVRLSYDVELTAQELLALDDEMRRSAGDMRSQNNLHQLALALVTYQTEHRNFPAQAIYSPDGRPLLSWRVAILPQIGQEKLYGQFKLDRPWDDPENLKLLDQMPTQFALPPEALPHTFAPARGGEPALTAKNATPFQVFVGPGAAFEGNKPLGPRDFTAGTDNVILVAEAAEPVLWTKPADLVVEATKPLPPLGNWFGKGFKAAMADGRIRTWNLKDLTPTEIWMFIRRDPQ